MTARLITLMGLALASGLAACADRHMPVPRTPTEPSRGVLRAGIAETDITPPIGLGMFGHGPESRVAAGTALRLRCQVFLIQGPDRQYDAQRSIALVPCDLPAPSLLLQREIAQRVRAKNVPIGADRLLLMATHTHSGPGHYFAVNNYLGVFSSRRIGFDPKLLDYLADNIADAVVAAWHSLQPVEIAWVQRSVGSPIARNRSLSALLSNTSLPSWLQKALTSGARRPADAAIDPTLSVLRIDKVAAPSAPAQPYGVFAVVGVHPSALPNSNDLYSGDLFGYATRAVSRKFGTGLITGVANGLEGDVMANRARAGVGEARRLGALLADEIMAAWVEAGSKLGTSANVQVGYQELYFPSAVVTPGGALCAEPALGTPAGGGASDHPTMLRLFPQYNQGVAWREEHGCHLNKLRIQQPLGPDPLGHDFPATAPISMVRIGDHVLATFPAELTTVAGARIRDAVAEVLTLPSDHDARGVVMVGLTNEYIQYVTTSDEYKVQLYEGASNLYGPSTAKYLEQQARLLARCLVDPQSCGFVVRGRHYPPNSVNVVEYPEPSGVSVMPDDGDDAWQLRADEPPRWRPFADGSAAWHYDFEGPRLAWAHRELHASVRVLGQLRHGCEDDDNGTTVMIRYDWERSRWTVSWLPDPARQADDCSTGTFQFVIDARGQRIVSSSFPGTPP